MVFVYERGNASLSKRTKWGQAGLDVDETEDAFGIAVATGDVNGDGRDDLVVGAPLEHTGSDISAGAANAYLGSQTATLIAWDEVHQDVIDADEEEDMFGRRLVIGDFNGDGLDDVAVGAPGERPGNSVRAGEVHIFKGGTSLLLPLGSIDQSALGTNEDLDAFSDRLAAGDFDDDGDVDLLAAAPGFPSGYSDDPFYVFQGTATVSAAWGTVTLP